jgi:DNA repair exonuclease SbcCD ATPase subunit
MARKRSTNPSHSKTTIPAKPQSADASSAQRQPTTPREKPDGEANPSPQSPLTNVTKDASVGVDTQLLPPQIIQPMPDSLTGIHELHQQLAALKAQVETVQSSYVALQQTSAEQARAIETLQGQLEQRNLEQSAQQDRYNILQQKAIEQTQTIEQLHDQIIRLDQSIEQRLSNQITQLKSDTIERQPVSDTVTIDALNRVQQQVAELQTEFNHQVTQQMTQQQRYEVLRQQYDEQEQVMTELRNLATQEQRYAAIGEAHLNKWRYRTFSS